MDVVTRVDDSGGSPAPRKGCGYTAQALLLCIRACLERHMKPFTQRVDRYRGECDAFDRVRAAVATRLGAPLTPSSSAAAAARGLLSPDEVLQRVSEAISVDVGARVRLYKVVASDPTLLMRMTFEKAPDDEVLGTIRRLALMTSLDDLGVPVDEADLARVVYRTETDPLVAGLPAVAWSVPLTSVPESLRTTNRFVVEVDRRTHNVVVRSSAPTSTRGSRRAESSLTKIARELASLPADTPISAIEVDNVERLIGLLQAPTSRTERQLLIVRA